MFCQIDKGMILVTTCTNDTHYRLSFSICKTEISTITTSTRYLLNVGGFCSLPLPIEFYEFLHIDCKGTKKK